MTAGNSQILRTIPFILIMALLCPFAYGRIIYVDDDAIGGNIGSNWLDAINSLQDALLLSYFYDKPVEIRVAKGIYTPDQGIGIMSGDQEASFELINGVTIKGGYAGLSDRPADARDTVFYETILSGDLEQNDGQNPENTSDNSYNVVTCSETDQTAVLDGVTISSGCCVSGRERSEQFSGGGGMYNESGSPMIINCTFRGSVARAGGGMYNSYSKPYLLNCTFKANIADDAGGAIYNYYGEPVLTNCTFDENSASSGGGIYSYRGATKLADCRFIGNSSGRSGGAVYNYGSILTFLSCTFKENSAVGDGGAIFNNSDFSSQANLTNCIFSRNSARKGGAIENGRSEEGFRGIIAADYNPSAVSLLDCTLSANSAYQGGGGISSDIQHRFIIDERTGLDNRTTLVNCILWGNTPDEIQEYMSESVVVLNSNVQGGFPGQGNIDVDPLFVDPENEDYHLKSAAGRWNPFSQNWVIDQQSSLCIDAGDPSTPVGLERFPNGDRINMGAYGGTPEASLSPQQQLLLPGQASNPNPPDGAVDVEQDVILSWTPGSNAVLHNVYFGTDYDEVSQSNLDDIRDVLVSLNQRSTSFDPGLLDFGQTYYWRVDEVNNEGNIIFGKIWMFTVTSPPGPPKGRACFTSETGVWLNGKLVPISMVASGRSINVIDSIKTVEKVQEHQGTFTCYDVLLESGASVTVAENHYFMTESEQWVSLQNLITDQILPSGKTTRLKTSKGSVGIVSITKRPMPYVGKVYNLKIKGSDRYLVGKDAIIVRDY